LDLQDEAKVNEYGQTIILKLVGATRTWMGTTVAADASKTMPYQMMPRFPDQISDLISVRADNQNDQDMNGDAGIHNEHSPYHSCQQFTTKEFLDDDGSVVRHTITETTPAKKCQRK